jgi:PTS system mannose-specific IID component
MSRGLLRAWARLFLLQASFNYDRMVGIGAAFATEPLLRSLPGGRAGERYRGALARAAEFFNTHPYLAGLGVGAIARAEHDGVEPRIVQRLHHALMSPLGALGDQLVWAGVLPATVGIGLVVATLVSPLTGALCFLVLYSGVHVPLRTWALRTGWRHGKTVGSALTGVGLRRARRVVGPAAAFTVGVAIPLAGAWLAAGFAPHTQVSVALVAAVGVVIARWLVPTLGSLRFGLLATVLALAVGWLA